MQSQADDHRKPLAEVRDVRVEFGDLVAVRDASIQLFAGDLVGLIGPNGAGKTTLLRVLAGLQSPSRGQALVMGRKILGGDDDVRRHVGFAPDSPPVYEELTILDFLLFIARAYGLDSRNALERIDFWLEQLWLADRRNERIRNLSKGMRQRVTIARTLVPNPDVVLLDEPSAGLDPAGRIQFRSVLASLRDQGKALIVSSHILADLEEYCTHIAIIEKGSVIRYGRADELHDRERGRRLYRITLSEGGSDIDECVRRWLGRMEAVSHLTHNNGTWELEFDESPARAAWLLRELVNAGMPISSFVSIGESLEQFYLRSGVKQVD